MGSEKRKSPTAAERALQVEIEQYKTARFMALCANLAGFGKVAAICGTAAFISWRVQLAVGTIAGQSTSFQAFVEMAFKSA